MTVEVIESLGFCGSKFSATGSICITIILSPFSSSLIIELKFMSFVGASFSSSAIDSFSFAFSVTLLTRMMASFVIVDSTYVSFRSSSTFFVSSKLLAVTSFSVRDSVSSSSRLLTRPLLSFSDEEWPLGKVIESLSSGSCMVFSGDVIGNAFGDFTNVVLKMERIPLDT